MPMPSRYRWPSDVGVSVPENSQSGTQTNPIWRHIAGMADPKEPKDQFARLMAQIEALRGRAVQEFTKALPPEKRKQLVDNLRDVLSKLTGRKS